MVEFFQGLIVEELLSLLLTLMLSILLWIAYAVGRIVEMGFLNAFVDSDTQVNAAWAQRFKSAYENVINGLVIFASAVIILHVLHLNSYTTALACMLYFLCKLAYIFLLPAARTVLYVIEAFVLVVLLINIFFALVI